MRSEDKIYIAELRKLIASKTGISEQETSTFLASLFNHITDGLIDDKNVKINGLGIFKLQWNAPRKSVNVSTGEPIILDGYNKVVFIPEDELKTNINKPFAQQTTLILEPEEKEVIDPLQKLGEQALEITGLLSEINEEPIIAAPIQEIELEENEPTLKEENSEEPAEELAKNDNAESAASEPSECCFSEEEKLPQSEVTETAETIIEESNTENIETQEEPTDEKVLTESEKRVSESLSSADELLKEIQTIPPIADATTENDWPNTALSSNEDTIEDAYAKEKTQTEETPIAEAEKLIDKTSQTTAETEIVSNLQETKEETDLQETKTESVLDLQEIKEETTINSQETAKEDDKEPGKPFHPWRVAGITLLIFCILLIGAFFYLRHGITSWCENMLNKLNKTENFNNNYIIAPTDTQPVVIDTTAIVQLDTIAPEENETVSEETSEIELSDTLAVVTLNEGSRLTHLARKYYNNNYHLWVYIYLANKNVLKNPDIIPIGQKIAIPRLPEQVIDINNAIEVQKADSIQDTIIK